MCFPVSDLDTEYPVGYSSSGTIDEAPQLRDCIQLKPGSTVYDLYEALKKGALSNVRVVGDFVRAEGTSLLFSKKYQLGRDAEINAENCVIKVQTNRKSVWQREHSQQQQQQQSYSATAGTITNDEAPP